MQIRYPLMAGAIVLAGLGYASAQYFPGLIGGGTVIGNTGTSNAVPGPTTAPVLGIPGTSTGQIGFAGATSGTVTVKSVPVAGSYNFNLPATAGTAGQPLISGGGVAAAQTYGTLGVSGGGTNCAAASGTCLDNITGFAANGVINRTGAGTYTQLTDPQLTTHIQPVTSTLSGAAPASGGGTTNFLRADGTWTSPTNPLLNTLTATSSASLIDTTSFTSSYSSYIILFESLVPAVQDFLQIQVSTDSGATWKNTSYISNAAVTFSSGTFSTSTSPNDPNASIILTQTNSNSLNATAGYGLSGIVRVFNPSGTTARKFFSGNVSYMCCVTANAADWAHSLVFGFWNGGNTAINGVKLTTGLGGNIASGIMRIYGVQ